MVKFPRKVLVLGMALSVGACSHHALEDAQYWHRKDVTSALYMQGPKAQQTLHMDISECVAEINELQRIYSIRKALPADTYNGRVPDPNTPEGRMAQWDTPERDGYLGLDHADYHDFETCMQAKGWERVENLSYDEADRARGEYIDNMGRKHNRPGQSDRELVTSVHANKQYRPPYSDLNN